MSKRIVEGIAVEASSGNVFADLGLTVEIAKAIRERGLTQRSTALVMKTQNGYDETQYGY